MLKEVFFVNFLVDDKGVIYKPAPEPGGQYLELFALSMSCKGWLLQSHVQINQIRTVKTLTRPLKIKLLKAKNKKNTTSNTVSEIQTSDSNQDTEIDKNYSDSMGCNNWPDLVMTSDNSDMSDTDENQ